MNGLLAAAIALSAALGVSGGDDPRQVLEPAFTGTIISTYPDGRISKVWLSRDGTFTSEGRAHEHKAGRWRLKRGDLCFTQSKPVPIPFLSYCTPVPPRATTASWTGKADTGEPITIRVTATR